MDIDPIFAEAMLDEVKAMLEEMLELASRAVEDDCSDEERDKMQARLLVIRERIDETVDAYGKLGEYRAALLAAWEASNDIMKQFKN